ncbi:hypothetical protein [Trichormus sp. NMC-1]|nr:hypothetical protein [Trichormus sp. NMC-1]
MHTLVRYTAEFRIQESGVRRGERPFARTGVRSKTGLVSRFQF